jgi:hypothetical protein
MNKRRSVCFSIYWASLPVPQLQVCPKHPSIRLAVDRVNDSLCHIQMTDARLTREYIRGEPFELRRASSPGALPPPTAETAGLTS